MNKGRKQVNWVDKQKPEKGQKKHLKKRLKSENTGFTLRSEPEGHSISATKFI